MNSDRLLEKALNLKFLTAKEGKYLFKEASTSELISVADKLRQIGMGSLVDNFEASMNKAAENAALEAKPIFVNAIKSMSIADSNF